MMSYPEPPVLGLPRPHAVVPDGDVVTFCFSPEAVARSIDRLVVMRGLLPMSQPPLRPSVESQTVDEGTPDAGGSLDSLAVWFADNRLPRASPSMLSCQ